MSEYTSPVPPPGPDTVPPEPYREIYPMPMFVNIPTADFAASKDFWMRGLGFIDLFSIPDQVAHLRRWAFQDILLVPGERTEKAPISVSFSCVLGQVEEIAARCEELLPGSVSGPAETPWNTVDVTVTTPEGARVVMTAARPLDRDGEKAAAMREMGLDFV
ncbi:MAG TPA: VOC family protein [Glycomyces sp.]|nr:VOC family protein [Glycomyces sp.]